MSNAGKITIAPTYATLHEAALRHLSRYAATRAGLLLVLRRRVERWAREAQTAGAEDVAGARDEALRAAGAVVDRLVEAGAVDDAAFAAQRARSLTRAGRSRRAVAAHLAGRGVAPEVAREAAPETADTELAAALATARRRRIGPFRLDPEPADAATRMRELATLARAGFAEDVARQALDTEHDAAERMVVALRRG